ncbi:hypothetical protein QYM36_012665 [Artemia franciscana]|uniref:Uncharacterized protein n=1 Tax=Artemia franciscana TaxID=6661 RepID=A0AA88HLG6_ARTSF|nr:hypothetical protein QYM36_012665 [Artemia franciscana]
MHYWLPGSIPLGQLKVKKEDEEAPLLFRCQDASLILVLIACAPTIAADESTVDEFYDALIQSLRTVPNRDLLILGGVLNAHVGSLETDRERAFGQLGWGDRCERGRRFVEFHEKHNLVLTNTLLQHKPSQRITWRSRDRRAESQVDYLLMSSRWRNSIQN